MTSDAIRQLVGLLTSWIESRRVRIHSTTSNIYSKTLKQTVSVHISVIKQHLAGRYFVKSLILDPQIVN